MLRRRWKEWCGDLLFGDRALRCVALRCRQYCPYAYGASHLAC